MKDVALYCKPKQRELFTKLVNAMFEIEIPKHYTQDSTIDTIYVYFTYKNGILKYNHVSISTLTAIKSHYSLGIPYSTLLLIYLTFLKK